MAETATNHHCLDRLNVSLTPQQELMTLYSSETPHLSGECLVNRGADLLNIIVEEIVCQTGYLPQDSSEKRDPLNLPAGEKFRVADFMTSAALASIALRAQPHASEKLRAARFSTHAKTVAAMLPKKRQAEAALALRKIEGAVARLDLPGDQKQAAVDAVKALAKDMPGAPILQRAAVTTMEGASRITDILTEETVRNRIIAAGAVTLTMMTSSLPAAAAEPKGNERDSAVVRVVDDNNPGTPNQQDESTKIQKSVEPAKSIAQMIDTAFKHDTPVKPVNDPTPTPHSDTPRQTVQINPNDGSSNFERVSHEPAVLAALSTELTTAGENALPEPTEPASAQPPTNQTVEPSTIDSRTERDTVQPTTDTPSNDQPSKQNSIEPSAEVDASPLASPPIEEAKGLGRISKIFGMLTKLGSDNNNGEKPDKAEKKDEVAETGAAMAQTLNLNDPKVQEEQRLSLLPEKASRGVLAGSPVAAAFIAGGEGVSSVIDTPPVDAKHLAVSEEELVDAMRNAVETVNKSESVDTTSPDQNVERMSKKEMQIAGLKQLEKSGGNWKNRAYVARYLLKHTDLNITQISGLIGNFCHEAGGCKLDPSTHQDGGPAIGIAQWDDRKPALLAFAKKHGMPWDSLELQCMFIVHELKGSEARAYSLLLKAKTVENAADIALNFYERPKARILAPRLSFANKTYSGFMKAYAKIKEKQESKANEQPESTTRNSNEKQEKLRSDRARTHTLNQIEKSGLTTSRQKLALKIVEAAIDEIGVEESPKGCDKGNPSAPGSCGHGVDQYTKGIREWWCQDFNDWVYRKAGVEIAADRVRSVTTHVQLAKRTNTWHDADGKYVPKPGDSVIIGYNNARPDPWQHVGIVEYVKDGYVHIIDGNSKKAPGSPNGTGVFRHAFKFGAKTGWRIQGYTEPQFDRNDGVSSN